MISQASNNTKQTQTEIKLDTNSPNNEVMFPQIKINIKSYPEFSGKMHDWKSFKQKCYAILIRNKTGAIMDETYVIPTDPHKLELFNNSGISFFNQFLSIH